MSKTQGHLCLVKKKRDSPKSISSTRVGFASSTFSTDSSPIQPALLIKQQARWLLPAHWACWCHQCPLYASQTRALTSSPPIKSSLLPSQRIRCIQHCVSLCLCSCSPSPGSPCLSCLTLKLTNIQNWVLFWTKPIQSMLISWHTIEVIVFLTCVCYQKLNIDVHTYYYVHTYSLQLNYFPSPFFTSSFKTGSHQFTQASPV